MEYVTVMFLRNTFIILLIYFIHTFVFFLYFSFCFPWWFSRFTSLFSVFLFSTLGLFLFVKSAGLYRQLPDTADFLVSPILVVR